MLLKQAKQWPSGLFMFVKSRLRGKENAMRVALWILGIGVSLMLASCGGGGGGPGQPSGTLTAAPSKCVASSGTFGCEVNLNVSTQNVSKAVITDQIGESIQGPVNGSAVLSVMMKPESSNTYTLDCGAGCSASVTVSAICAPGTYSTGVTCEPKLTYSNIVYGLADSIAFPFKVIGTSCATMRTEIAKNETRFQKGFYPHFNVWLHTETFPSGRIREAGQMPQDGDTRHTTVLNPLTNVLSDYAGEEGPMPTIDPVIDDGWYRFFLTEPPHPNPEIAFFVYLDDMMVYVTSTQSHILRCQDMTTGVVTEVTRALGSVISLRAYSN